MHIESTAFLASKCNAMVSQDRDLVQRDKDLVLDLSSTMYDPQVAEQPAESLDVAPLLLYRIIKSFLKFQRN